MSAGLECRGKTLDLRKPVIMGVLNVTPDSFSDGGQFSEKKAAIERAERMVEEGASIIDIGGESTRPGAQAVPAQEELRRVLPVLEEVKKLGAIISIDTYKPEVAAACLGEGAHIINDITGLENGKMAGVAAEFNAPVVIMHMRGNPRTMQENPQYRDVVGDIKGFFAERIEKAQKAGIEKIILDPGIGFGKSTGHNLEIIGRLHEFMELGFPIMLGTSRKSFIGKIAGGKPAERLGGTIASNTIGLLNGARIFRVHDVKENKRALETAWEIMQRNALDRVIIRGLGAEALVGVSETERSRKQKLVIDVEVAACLKRAAASEKMVDTVDYVEAVKEIRETLKKKPFVLLESIAAEVAGRLKKRFNAERVAVKVGKKKVAEKNKAEFVGVELVD
jgi:dihydropteroate synthase